MADDLKFSEDGVKLHESLAKMLDEWLKAEEGVTIGTLGLTMGGVIGVAAFVITLIEFMTSDDDREMVEAMKMLQRQIDEIKGVLVMLDRRIDQLVNQVAIESNRQTLRDLLDYLDSFRQLDIELIDRSHDADTAVRVANEAGILCDKFLRSDFEIWRWTDVVIDATGQNALAPLRFKNMPTLPVYAAGILTWLTARELAVKAGQKHRLVDDQPLLDRHRFATSVRTEFDKYHIDDPTITRDDNYATPLTIAENIKYRIRAYPTASTTHAVNRICQFYFDVGNMMTGKRQTGAGFDLLMPEGTVLCTLDPNAIGSPDMEIEMETAAGIDALYELSKILGRLASGGSLREQFIGVFPNTEVYPPAVLYFITQNADLHWYRNEESSRPGGSTSWQGPLKVGNGWGGFTTVFSGGGAAIYAVRPDGVLLWYGHDGCYDGSPRWRGPHQVGHGWQGLQSIFSGGEYVVYGIQPNGDLLWYRHHGAPSGGDITTWNGQVKVGSGWAHFAKVFSGGDGIIYAIQQDGVLLRYKHLGYLDGTLDWELYTDLFVTGAQPRQHEKIGTGWNGFREVLAAGDGVIYAFTRDGRILWYRYGKRRPPEHPIDFPDVVTLVGERWEGPVEIKRSLPGFRSVFSLMAEPFVGPH
jgi:hypothetical protein